MSSKEHLGAVFSDRARAEDAVAELRRRGLSDDRLGVAVHGVESRVFEERTETEVAHGMERGIATGAPLGAIAGMSVLALVVPGVGTLGVGGVLAAGAITGAVAGTYIGALLGLASEDHVLREEWDWDQLPLEPGQVLVVVADHDRPDDVMAILRRNGGDVVATPHHVT
jgi:hypothetical protein